MKDDYLLIYGIASGVIGLGVAFGLRAGADDPLWKFAGIAALLTLIWPVILVALVTRRLRDG